MPEVAPGAAAVQWLTIKPGLHCYVRVLLQLSQLRGAQCALTRCPFGVDDSVYLSDEKERQEYVMNEDGIIFKGSGNYIFPLRWDFGQVTHMGLHS